MYNPNTTSKLYSVLVEDSISVRHATDSSDYWPGVVPRLGRRPGTFWEELLPGGRAG